VATADYHLFFWHASYGYAGTPNDINILHLSPMLDRIVDGSLHTLVEKSEVVLYRIGDGNFKMLLLLVETDL
jgi:hypothetical protein